MDKVLVKEHGDVALVRLNNSVTNSLTFELVVELSQALDLVKERFKGLVLAGGPKLFSMGFDLPSLLKGGRPEMAGFYKAINQLWLALYTLPLPTVAAVQAHAIAGGTILAIMCDWRVAAKGRTLFGLNEIKLGVPVPYLSDLVLRQLTGERAADRIIFGGEFLDSAQALEIGLVDQVAAKEEVEALAIAKAQEMAVLPGQANREIKSCRVARVAALYAENHQQRNAAFLDIWFSKQTLPLLEKAAEKF
jgi:enoyl-CoA hydratase/carnithine racemase